jgi:hypothetical protein
MPAHAPGVGIGVVFAPTYIFLLSLSSKNHDNRHCQVEAFVRQFLLFISVFSILNVNDKYYYCIFRYFIK